MGSSGFSPIPAIVDPSICGAKLFPLQEYLQRAAPQDHEGLKSNAC